MCRLLLLALIVLVNSALGVFSQEVEILSKDDARELFSMTKDQWYSNVREAAAAGAAEAVGTPETGLGMAMSSPGGDLLIVKPNYGDNPQKPDFIQVTVGYPEPTAAFLTDPGLEDVVEAARAQMGPEYEVIGNIERISSGLAMYFVITEKKPE